MVVLNTFPFGILLLLPPLLLLSRIQFSHGFTYEPSLGEMEPDNPLVEVGDTLVLNCTLTPFYNGTYNASDIYFRHSNLKFTYPEVQTLSNITAQLRLPNITSDMWGAYNCYLPPRLFLGAEAAQSLHVVRRPLKPVLDDCIISNWEKMECSWSPSLEEQIYHTLVHKSFIQTLFYRSPPDDDNWKNCSQSGSNNCTWPSSQFQMGATYCIQINATNILNHIVASNVTCVSAQEEIVKPNPPKNVVSSFASEYDGHVTLTWNPPTTSYKYETPLLYQLNIQNHWKDQIDNITNATSMRLHIVPATSYTVQISVRSSRLGFASDNATERFVTPATVPCKNPPTQTNAFHLVKETGKVLLYWQPISARDFCGSNLSYEVRARQKSDGATESAMVWRDVSSATPHDNCTEVTLRREEDEVTILSKNSVGIANQLPHVVIRIPSSLSKANASLGYKLVVEGDANNFALVRWFATEPVENVTDYTLFWCQRLSSIRLCQTPIQWQNLDGSESEYSLTLSENYLHYQVGLAVNFRSGFTTGIMWADRLYSQTKKVEAPGIVKVVTPYLGSHGEIDISWTPAPCNKAECAYVDTFVIFYCLADHQNKCHGENESVSIAAWKSSTYSLVNLEHGSTYKIWMTSVGRAGSSNPSESKLLTTTKSWLTAGAVAGIIVAILCVGTIVVAGLYIIMRCLHKYRKEFVNGLNVPIAMPPTHRVQLPSTSSEAPMLGTKFEYSRQGSGSSGDSGRYSLSPASPATLPLLSKMTDANENHHSFMPGNFSILEDSKAGEDDDSTHGCVLSYTIVSNNDPEGGSVVPNGIPLAAVSQPNGGSKMGDFKNPGVKSNADVTGHSKYILPEQIELLGMFPVHPESDVNYCTSFSFACPSTGNTSGNSAADIGYTKVENLQPLYDLVDRLPTVHMVNEQSQDSDVLLLDSDKAEAPVEQSDLGSTIDQLLATLSTDPLLITDLEVDDRATSSENNKPELAPPPSTRPGDIDAPFCEYMKIGNTDFPSMACDGVEWGAGTPDFPQQLPSSNWGYVDHAMFGVDSVA